MAIINTNGTGGGLWNDGATWEGGVVPLDTDKVVVKGTDTLIVEGTCICGDGTRTTSNSSTDAQLVIEAGGTLKASRAADSYLGVKGQIYIKAASGVIPMIDYGFEGDVIPDGITATINFNEEGSGLLGYYNGIFGQYYNTVDFPKIYFKGGIERIRNTYLTSFSASGTNIINVKDITNWKVGDKLRLAPKYNDVNLENPTSNHNFETVEIQSINGNEITLTTNLLYDHGYDALEDLESAVVSNMTGNIILTAGGDDKIFYGIKIERSDVNMQDVVFEYANNAYNYNTCPLRLDYPGIYVGNTLKRIAMIGDNRNLLSKNLQGFIYLFSSFDYFPNDINDIAIIGIESDGYYNLYRGVINYYGGRPIDLYNIVVMAGVNYRGNKGFNGYQQPANYINCKAVGMNYGFDINNNVNITTNNCYFIGCGYGYTTYNGTSLNYDMQVRYTNYISYMYSGWRGSSKVFRPNFLDRHLKGTYDTFDLISKSTSLPDGNEIELKDIQNNPSLQQTFYSFGAMWLDNTYIRNDDYSIGLYSISDTVYTKYSKTFNSSLDDNIIVGFYIKNITNYIGDIKLSIIQGSDILKEEIIDLTTLTENEWTLLTISATAIKTISTNFNIEYKGNGGKIAITDFILPATKDEKSQARAIWAELQNENNVTGSMGEKLNQLENYNDTIAQDKLDVIKTETDKIQPEIIDKKDEFKATEVVATNMRGTDNANTIEPDNAGISAIQSKVDTLENYDDNLINEKITNIESDVKIIKDLEEGDEIHTKNNIKKLNRTTKEIILDKKVVGGNIINDIYITE